MSVRPPRPPRELLSAAAVERRLDELALEIDHDYRTLGAERLTAIGVLKGSVFFLVDLLKRLKTPVEVDFLQAASYGSGTSGGEVRIRKDVDLSLRGKHVLLVEDIVDTGHTLRTILDLLRYRGAASVRLCALLDKPSRRRVEVPIDYLGFSIDDVFVVGYGLDFDERYRNLPYVGVLEDAG